MQRRVVITGMGAVSPIGNDVETMWSAARNGVCGIGEISAFDTSAQRCKIAGETKISLSEHFEPAELRRLDRNIMLSVVAGRQAFEQSGISAENTDLTRCGVMISSGIGGLSTIMQEHSRGLAKGFDRVSPFFIPMSISNMAASRIAIEIGFKGYCSAVVTACAGGTNAVGDAFRQIRHGYADVMLCGGGEACVNELAIGGFTSMKALSESTDPARASIPFDAERSGFVLGEGAGALMLEEYEHARARGAMIICEVVGYGATCDAFHITAPEPSGECAANAMSMAIADAGLTPEQISYINAHGTSTPLNDRIETAAIKSALGPAASTVLISSTKSMMGHLLGGAGAVEGIICALALRDGFVPPTIGYKMPDPECDLDFVPNVGRSAVLEYAMSNSLGFGGHNASIILKKLGE